MRPSWWLVSACLAPAALASCAPTDPDLSKPCGQRRTADVEMGIGQFQFVPLGAQGPLLDTDLQQGDYVWLGIGCQGLGPDVTVSFGITDTTTGAELSLTSGDRPPPLTYDTSTDRDEAPGLQAYFDPGVDTKALVGRAVTLWADVSDSCHATAVRGEKASRIEGFDISTCVGCLDEQCYPEMYACDQADCASLQGCLDTYCLNLSAIGSPDEDACQAFCQGEHAAAKNPHIALVACVEATTCSTLTCFDNPIASAPDAQVCFNQPPCFSYSIDYRHCVNQQNDPATGPCKDLLAACANSPDCKSYQTCLAGCTSWTACQKCASDHAQGEMLLEQYQTCVEKTCLAEGWLPHLQSE